MALATIKNQMTADSMAKSILVAMRPQWMNLLLFIDFLCNKNLHTFL